MNMSRPNLNSVINNSPLPGPGNEGASRPGSSQPVPSQQPQSVARAPAPTSAEQVHAFLTGESQASSGEVGSFPHTNPSIDLPSRPSKLKRAEDALRRPANLFPKAGSKTKSLFWQATSRMSGHRNRKTDPGPSSSAGDAPSSETPGEVQKPRVGINDLPNEVLDKIFERDPECGIERRLRDLTTLSRVNQKFRRLVLPGPLQPSATAGPLQQERLELLSLKTIRDKYRDKYPDTNPYFNDDTYTRAMAMKYFHPALTLKQTVLLASDRSDSALEKYLSRRLDFQPDDVKTRIAALREGIQLDRDKDPIGYGIQLKKDHPELTVEDATFAACGDLHEPVMYHLSMSLEFQLPEVRNRIEAFRRENPRKQEETNHHDADFHYAERLMKPPHNLSVVDAAVVAMNTPDQDILGRLQRAAVEISNFDHGT